MTFKEVFEGIQSVTENVLFAPFDLLRFTDSWFFSNIVSWILMLIGFVAFLYWMGELKKYNDNDEENRSQTSHGYLGDVPAE
ncbi:MAG: uracil phosphoribosyltransferase [Flavobacteriaceae bacterium]|nr:uracil phosphoribosyltransferase [Flavobacteriaceae bacterium]